jgi:membrane protease YdiL (CAAX protease family)
LYNTTIIQIVQVSDGAQTRGTLETGWRSHAWLAVYRTRRFENEVISAEEQQDKEARMNASGNRYLVRYFISTCLVFWMLLGITGAMIALKVPTTVQIIMKNLCAWSPTLVIIMLYRKIYPGITVKEYLKRNFLFKVNPFTFLIILIIQVLIAAFAVSAHLLTSRTATIPLTFTDLSSLPLLVLITATAGATGEELGWRGYASGELEKKFPPFVSALILGAVWGFWHTPLWLISGYTGMKLAYYILFFMTGIVSISVVITVFFNRNRNILVPMWIHFLFNLLLIIPKIELLPLLGYTSLGYLILAVVLAATDRKMLFRKLAV